MDKKDFIKGKYYKNLSIYAFIAKFDRFEGNDFYSDGFLIDNGKYIPSGNNVGNITNNWKNAIECPYEEYSKFLPAGHIDLKPPEIELIEGQWYSCILNEGKPWFFKYVGKTKAGDIECSLCIQTVSKWTDKVIGTIINKKDILTTNIQIADMKEVYKYFPEERPKIGNNIKLSDLKEGEYYRFYYGNIAHVICKCTRSGVAMGAGIWGKDTHHGNTDSYNRDGHFYAYNTYEIAEKNDILWLNKCIEADKFISKGEALKTISSELTTLPKKWFITVTSQNTPELTKFKISKGKNEANDYRFVCCQGYGYGDRNYIDKVAVEITTDQFNKWVLKESSVKEEYIPKEGDWLWGIGNIRGSRKEELGKFIRLYNTSYKCLFLAKDGTYTYEMNIDPPDTKSIRKARPNEIPNTISPSIEEDWCIQVTDSNREVIMEWFKPYHKGEGYTIGYYYGLSNSLPKVRYMDSWGKLLTTEEFYKKIGKSIPNKEENLVGRWLKALKNGPNGISRLQDGSYVKIKNNVDALEPLTLYDNSDGWMYSREYILGIGKETPNWELMPLGWSPEVKNSSVMSKEEILEEAKRKYTIGIKFKSEFDDNGKIREIQYYPGCDKNGKGLNFRYNSKDQIRVSINSNSGCSDPLIYNNGKWAEIVSSPKQESKIEVFNGIFVGDVVVRTEQGGEWKHLKTGSLTKVGELSKKNVLAPSCMEVGTSIDPCNWRKTTIAETEWYNKGVRNINDIPKERDLNWGELPSNSTFKTVISKAEVLERYPLTYGDAYYIGVDPYKKTELSISDVFKSKKSVKMSYTSEQLQTPRDILKFKKVNFLNI